MLGLGNAVTKQQEWSPGYISDLIGWWDFSDLSTMFQERDGTFVTPCPSATTVVEIARKSVSISCIDLSVEDQHIYP